MLVAGCGPQPAPVATAGFPERLETVHLPNALRIHAKVISGGQPAGDAGFRELVALGVKTIISVDGAKPDVALAKKHGLRYVHLPHGYDGIPESRVKDLAKAVRDLPGPIYIHCHHGKHRSPAASSVACVSAGLIDPTLAVTVLKSAGTSENYRGLYASARDARKLDDQLLDALAVEFPENARIPPLAEAMVALEHTHDDLKSVAAAGWKMPPDHPDLEPAHEALLMREHYMELLRAEAAKRQPTGFQRLLLEGEATAVELEQSLTTWQAAGYAGEAPAEIPAAFKRLEANCTACHKAYRDVPLSEKGH
jgi:protein tyrosine phosphatase (PTP) superfamily phosphohydrolase (DUF442 family)